MKLLKTTVALAAILAPLAFVSTGALAQERQRMGPREGRGEYQNAQPQAAPAPQGGGERQRMGPRGGGEFRQAQPQVQAQADGGRFRGGQGGDRGNRGDRGGFRGGRNNGGQAQIQAPQQQFQGAPVQQQFQGGRQDRGQRSDNRGDQGRNAFRGGDNNRFDNRGDQGRNNAFRGNDNRFDGRNDNRGGFDNRYRGDNRFDNRNDNRYRGGGYNRGGQRFSYRGRDFFRFQATPYAWPRGYASRSWSTRQILPSLFLSNQYYLNDFYDYGLDEPPYGYQWVRVGEDALLVNLYTGEILDVVPGVFYW